MKLSESEEDKMKQDQFGWRNVLCYFMSYTASGTVAVIIDTSGGINFSKIADFWKEIRRQAEIYQLKNIVVIQADMNVLSAIKYNISELPNELELQGGSGTSYKSSFHWLEEHNIKPNACFYLSDLECWDFPDKEPDYLVLWYKPELKNTNRFLLDKKVPWGHIVNMVD